MESWETSDLTTWLLNCWVSLLVPERINSTEFVMRNQTYRSRSLPIKDWTVCIIPWLLGTINIWSSNVFRKSSYKSPGKENHMWDWYYQHTNCWYCYVLFHDRQFHLFICRSILIPYHPTTYLWAIDIIRRKHNSWLTTSIVCFLPQSLIPPYFYSLNPGVYQIMQWSMQIKWYFSRRCICWWY